MSEERKEEQKLDPGMPTGMRAKVLDWPSKKNCPNCNKSDTTHMLRSTTNMFYVGCLKCDIFAYGHHDAQAACDLWNLGAFADHECQQAPDKYVEKLFGFIKEKLGDSYMDLYNSFQHCDEQVGRLFMFAINRKQGVESIKYFFELLDKHNVAMHRHWFNVLNELIPENERIDYKDKLYITDVDGE